MPNPRADTDDWINDSNGLMQLIDLSPHELQDQVGLGEIALSLQAGIGSQAGKFRLTVTRGLETVRSIFSLDGALINQTSMDAVWPKPDLH